MVSPLARPLLILGLCLAGCSAPDETPAPPTREGAPAPSGGESWSQWGGPTGDFKVRAAGVAETWPADGPDVLWERPLGDGYSAVAAVDGVLYTMYRDGDDEIAVAIEASGGETIWEQRYAAPTSPEHVVQFGKGPNASPLVLDERVFTIGYTGLLKAFDRTDGKVLWEHDLIVDFGGERLKFGSSASPVAVDGRVIVLVGGERHGVVAFSPEDGSVVWSSEPGTVSYATPSTIDVDGQKQIVYFAADAVVGIDAADGSPIWSFPVVNQYLNNCTPVQWGDDGLLWVATQLDGGTRALRLTRTGETTDVEEVWSSNKLSIHFWNTLRLGSHVFASIGSNASILAGIDMTNGEILWRERGYTQVNFVHAGDQSLLLDADGRLALARLTAEGIDVKAETTIEDGPTWTAPTLVGTTLYVRGKQTLRALDLGS